MTLVAGIPYCVDPRQICELDAAIVAHCEWLKSEKVQLRVAAPDLSAFDLLHFSPMELGGRLVVAVVTSLRALCALRTRVNVRALRARAREQASSATKAAPLTARAEAKRFAKQVRLINDDAHFEPLKPSIKQAAERLRTASKKLEAFKVALQRRHANFVRVGLEGVSGAPVDVALTRWVMQRCDALEADLQFFLTEIEGPVAAASIGHPTSPDSKAWFRVRSEAKLGLKEGGAPNALAIKLFPSARARATDRGAMVRKKDADRKERKRAEDRRTSNR